MSNKATQFKPGNNANPKGRPKAEWTWAGLIKEIGEEIDPKTGEPFKRGVVMGLYRSAKAGNPSASKVMMDRTDGSPKESVDHTTLGEKIEPLVIYRPEKNKE